MRTIKFRAWDTRKKVMARVYSITSDIDEVNWVNLYGGHEVKGLVGNNNLVLMQFTGLLDKNGKEIYEGDIFSFTNGKHRTIGYVVFEDAMFKMKDNAGWGAMMLQREKDIEVIGNIYESKYLLD